MCTRWIQGLVWGTLLGAVAGTAEQVVVIRDTVLEQGRSAALPIWVQLQLEGDRGLLRLSLFYSAQRLRILGIQGNGQQGLCGELSFWDTVFNGDTGRVDLYCSASVQTYTGILGWLEVEVLAGRDTVAWIHPFELRSGEQVLPLRATTAWIRIEGGPLVEPVGVDEVRIGAPNPFADRLWVHYAVARPGWVSFQLFSVSGIEIPLMPSRVYAPRVGSYVIGFRFLPWEIASGGYVLRMVTERGTVRFLWLLCVK